MTRRTLNIIVPLKENYDKVRIMLARLEKALKPNRCAYSILPKIFGKDTTPTAHQ